MWEKKTKGCLVLGFICLSLFSFIPNGLCEIMYWGEDDLVVDKKVVASNNCLFFNRLSL